MSETEPRSARTETLRLVSWNVHGTPVAPRTSERLAAIAGAVSARAPALVLFQEVWSRSDAAWLEDRFAREGYIVVRIPSGGLWMRTSGLLALVHERRGWQASAARFHEFTVEAADWKVWEGDGLGDKGVQGFTVSREGLSFEVLHTHLQAAYQEGGYAEVRRAQLRELRALVATVTGRPVLVAGDLNTDPAEAAWQEVADLRDLAASLRARCGCGTHVAEPGHESSQWIDHLLAHVPAGWTFDARLSLLRSQRPDVPYSDHQGIDAVCRIEAPPLVPASLASLAAARLAAGPLTRREWLANAALWLGARGLGV